MPLIRFLLLWGLVSVHIVGGAALFRRWFPRESPWLGFFVPSLAIVVVLNFVEHQVAIPTLRFLLPVTTLGCLWLLLSPQTNWRRLRLPAILFVSCFAFTLFLRFLKPDIAAARDGIYDLQFISTFLMGQTLPAESIWIPPLPLISYYAFGHYGASVLIRLFGLDVGTGFNVSVALVSAWIYFLTAGIAWNIGRRKLWITIVAPILVACCATGSAGYLTLTIRDDLTPEDLASLYSRFDTHDEKNFLFHFLKPVYMYDRHELLVPGWASWMGIFHSTALGQFLTLAATLCITEIVRRKRSNWPWICLLGIVPITIVSSSWAFPYITLLVATALGWFWYRKCWPENPRWVILGAGAVTVCLTPMLLYYLMASMPIHGTVQGEEHTQIAEFIVQWWPIYLPYLYLLFTCRRVHPVVAMILLVTPIAFAGVEYYTVGARFDMTGKIWGFIFCAAWATFIPAIATTRRWIPQIIFGLIVVNCTLSLAFWSYYYYQNIDWNKDVGDLDGKGDLHWDTQKARILNALIPVKGQIIAVGESSWSFCPSARIANFSGNRAWITWSFNCDNDNFRNGLNEGEKREIALNNFYAGKDPNPLLFLRQRNIAAVVIWPDDHIEDAVLNKLKEQLAPTYQYEDLRDLHNQNPPNCGIFLYYPNLLTELPPASDASTTGGD